jgi:predicted nucleotide-binding protein (sugar kinase/HSP70/actin superfamily)
MKNHKLLILALLGILKLRKEFETRRIRDNLREALPRYDEPSFREVVANASSYVGFDNNNIVLLNISKMVDFAQRGADGVINAICFNCMLGTISEAISTRIREDFDNIPIPTLVFSGTDGSSENTKLEAFVYQVHQSFKSKKYGFFS